jgi:uncharacterized membrane protein YcaP (DUF421 family)
MNEFLHNLIYASNNTITAGVMTLRGIIVFFFAVLLIKLGGKRIFGKQTTIDIIIGITMGTILAKGVTGSAPFPAVLITCSAMAVLHRILAVISFYSGSVGRIIKGTENLLVENGHMNVSEMRRTNISEKDLYEAFRTQGIEDIKKVKKAFLERSGKISAIQSE